MTADTEDFFFLRPGGDQRIAVGKRQMPSPVEKIFPAVPKIGLVISTFGAPAYVDLALTIRDRLYPEVPVLVHDDASHQAHQLAAICAKHGALFESNSSRLGHLMGDLSSVVGGLRWAQETRLDLLVKMSRRFIPTVAWNKGLESLAMFAQQGTYGRECQSYRYPLRTECFAMAIEPWSEPNVAGAITEFMLKNQQSILIEQFLWAYACKVYEFNCVAARNWETKYMNITPRPPYVGWDFVSPSRKQPSPGYLWHDTASPQEYAHLAGQLGLNYPAEAFSGFSSPAGF